MNAPGTYDSYTLAREKMVEEQLVRRDITDPRVLEVMAELPRHIFVDKGLRGRAYGDHPLPIGQGQTISQPYIVAFMTQALRLQGDEKVLEVGTGSGYQAAVLARLCENVFTIERVPALARRARRAWDELDIHNIAMRIGDGTLGWSQYAPYDGILVTAAGPRVPEPLLEQLHEEGSRLVIPVGGQGFQKLKIITRDGEDYQEREESGVSFVPLLGRHGWKRD